MAATLLRMLALFLLLGLSQVRRLKSSFGGWGHASLKVQYWEKRDIVKNSLVNPRVFLLFLCDIVLFIVYCVRESENTGSFEYHNCCQQVRVACRTLAQ